VPAIEPNRTIGHAHGHEAQDVEHLPGDLDVLLVAGVMEGDQDFVGQASGIASLWSGGLHVILGRSGSSLTGRPAGYQLQNGRKAVGSGRRKSAGRRDGPDLTARQLGVFLTCYLETEAQTVRGLAARLNVSKPAITRALDRLSEFDLVRRKTDPLDRRSVLVQRTATGMAFQRELRTVLRDAATAMHLTVEPASGGRQRVSA
jgi:DNA-binding MarR family transcriptional regulator